MVVFPYSSRTVFFRCYTYRKVQKCLRFCFWIFSKVITIDTPSFSHDWLSPKLLHDEVVDFFPTPFLCFVILSIQDVCCLKPFYFPLWLKYIYFVSLTCDYESILDTFFIMLYLMYPIRSLSLGLLYFPADHFPGKRESRSRFPGKPGNMKTSRFRRIDY